MDRRSFLQGTTIALAAAGAALGSAPSAIAQDKAVPLTGLAPTTPSARMVTNYQDFLEQLNQIVPFGSPDKSIAPGILTAAVALSKIDLPQELQPIDVGADEFLKAKVGDRTQYSPFEVEYLVGSLDALMKECLELRDKAQQLELLAIAGRLEIGMEAALIDFMESVSTLGKDNDDRVLASMYLPKLQADSTIVSSGSTEYRDKKFNIDVDLITRRRGMNDGRALQFNQLGGANNFAERAAFIRNEFKATLTEAYIRASAAFYGLKYVYQIDLPLPDLSHIGYVGLLADWSREIIRRLERRLLGRSQTSIVIPLSAGMLSPDEFQIQRKAGTFKFNLTDAYFSQNTLTLKNPRMRGLDVYLWSDATTADNKVRPLDFARIAITLPEETIQEDGLPVWSSNKEVQLGLVTYPNPPLPEATARHEIHNVNPSGEWSLTIDKKTLLDQSMDSDSVLKNILLVMSVTYDAV